MSFSGVGKLLTARSDEELRQMIADMPSPYRHIWKGAVLGVALALLVIAIFG